jgi:hypothetical protein
MQLNSFQFPDRSRIETFSQKQQQIIVNQQTPAIPANQVTGTTGQPFVAISPQSMVVSTNGATDLVGGQIQMAMSQQILQTVAVQPDNTFVAMLSPDRQTWMIQETMRSINSTDMTVRMVKRNQLDGEYMIVGRQTVEVNTLVQPFGSTVAIQGSGLQENEYQDGFRMSTRATQPVAMVVDVKDGIDPSMLAGLQGQSSVNDYRYSVVTNLGAVTPELNQQVTVVQMPSTSLVPALLTQLTTPSQCHPYSEDDASHGRPTNRPSRYSGCSAWCTAEPRWCHWKSRRCCQWCRPRCCWRYPPSSPPSRRL